MGAGSSLEAAYTLQAPIAAGTWHLVGDGIVLLTSDVTYELVWRSAAGDQSIAQATHHFDSPPAGQAAFDAVPFETDLAGAAAHAKAGDQLVLRFSVANVVGGGTGFAFIPNGDSSKANGRIPSVKLP